MVADEPLENILAEYYSVFKGIGCLPGEYDLAIDESITPVQVRPRKTPLSMKEEVKSNKAVYQRASRIADSMDKSLATSKKVERNFPITP